MSVDADSESEALIPESTSSASDAPEVLSPAQTVAAEPAPATPTKLENISETARERISVEPVPDWVLDQPYDATPDPKSHGRCELLLWDEQANAGLKQTYHRTAQRLDTMNAVHGASQWTLQMNPANQSLRIHSVALRRGEERIEQASLAKLRLLQRESNLEGLVMSGLVTVVLILEDVRLGDILDASYTITTRPRILPERFSLFVMAHSSFPMRHFRFRAIFPTGSGMQWKSPRASMAPAVQEIGSLTEWCWELPNVQPPVLEPRIPSSVFPAPWIQISDLASWAELAEAVPEGHVEYMPGEELRRQAEAIASVEPTLLGRATRALNFVQDEIRYLSDNIKLGGIAPTDPDTVLRRRFGDCKDKSFLLFHLFRTLGIPARPWWVATGLDERLRTLLPAFFFNHEVIEYEVEGQRRWADATSNMQGGNALNRATPYFRVGLPLGPNSRGLEIFPLSPTVNLSNVTERFRLDTAMTKVYLVVTNFATGAEADGWRRAITNAGAHGLADSSLKHYQGLYPGAKRLGDFEWRDDRERNIVEIGEEFELPGFLRWHAKGYQTNHSAYHIQSILRLPSSDSHRKFSLDFPHPSLVEHHIVIENPKFHVQPEKVRREQNQFFSFTLENKRADGQWSEQFRIETHTATIASKDYPAFRERVDAVWPLTNLGYTMPTGARVAERAPESPILSQKFTSDDLIPIANSGTGQAATTEAVPLPEHPAPPLGAGQPVPNSPDMLLESVCPPGETIRIDAPASAEAEPPKSKGGVNRPPVKVGEAPTIIAPKGPIRVIRRHKSSRGGIDPVWRWIPVAVIIFLRLIFMLIPHR